MEDWADLSFQITVPGLYKYGSREGNTVFLYTRRLVGRTRRTRPVLHDGLLLTEDAMIRDCLEPV